MILFHFFFFQRSDPFLVSIYQFMQILVSVFGVISILRIGIISTVALCRKLDSHCNFLFDSGFYLRLGRTMLTLSHHSHTLHVCIGNLSAVTCHIMSSDLDHAVKLISFIQRWVYLKSKLVRNKMFLASSRDHG